MGQRIPLLVLVSTRRWLHHPHTTRGFLLSTVCLAVDGRL